MGKAKQLLAVGGSTMTGLVVRTLLDVELSAVVVVTRTELIEGLRLPVDSRVHVAINDDPHSEMIDSVRIGLARLIQFAPHRDDGVLVVPADMPTLSAASCRACLAAFTDDRRQIVIARHAGRRGHPIVFPLAMQSLVNGLDGGLNLLPRRHPDKVLFVDVDDPGVGTDIDTPDDYGRLHG
jgi:molybdenum cofactor cytidylyltransferase